MPSRRAARNGGDGGPKSSTANRDQARRTEESATTRAAEEAEELARAQRKRKRKLERPPPLCYHERFFALSQQRCTGAYDERQATPKRRKRDKPHKRDKMERPARLPVKGAQTTFGAPTTPIPAASMVPRALRGPVAVDPIASMGTLGRLPAETRDEVLRYVLVWPRDVEVRRGWTLAYPRPRPRLSGLAVLCTCEVLRRQGARVLYGENRFAYVLRDPRRASDSVERVLRGVYHRCAVPVIRYGHLIRHVRVVVEANRMGCEHHRSFVHALTGFGAEARLGVFANLHTVTIEVPALTAADLWDNAAAGAARNTVRPPEVPIYDFFDRKAVTALRRINAQFIRILATACGGRMFESVTDMRSCPRNHWHKDNNGDGYYYDDLDMVDRVMIDTREKRAHAALARLETLPYYLQLLALDPRKVVSRWNFWTPVKRDKPTFEEVALSQESTTSMSPSSTSPTPQPMTPAKTQKRPHHLTVQDLEEGAGSPELDNAMASLPTANGPEEKLNLVKLTTAAAPVKPEATTSMTKITVTTAESESKLTRIKVYSPQKPTAIRKIQPAKGSKGSRGGKKATTTTKAAAAAANTQRGEGSGSGSSSSSRKKGKQIATIATIDDNSSRRARRGTTKAVEEAETGVEAQAKNSTSISIKLPVRGGKHTSQSDIPPPKMP